MAGGEYLQSNNDGLSATINTLQDTIASCQMCPLHWR